MDSGAEENNHPFLHRNGAGIGVQQASGWLDVLMRVSPVGIFRADPQGRCIYVNARWSEFTGIPAEKAVGRQWDMAVHPEHLSQLNAAGQRLVEEGIPFKEELRYLRADGSIVWGLAEVLIEHAADGTIAGFIAVVTDITELRQIREELQRSQSELEEGMRQRAFENERLARIVQVSDDAIIGATMDGKLLTWNKTAERLFGYSRQEVLGQSPLILVPETDVDAAREKMRRVRGGERFEQLEQVLRAKNGQLIEVVYSLLPMSDPSGTVVGTVAIIRDISEQKKAQRRLRRLSARLMRLQDEERRRIAREIHDSTVQTLAALALTAGLLQKATKTGNVDEQRALITDIRDLADEAIRELRTQSYLLHPPLLDERGLPAALRWFTSGFAKRSGIAIDAEIAENVGRFSPDAELAVFRVVQEALTNVHRHSRSPSARVSLQREGDWIVLEVRDYGCGMPANRRDEFGVGIAGMKERLFEFGGTLTVASSPEGTSVVARIPLNP